MHPVLRPIAALLIAATLLAPVAAAQGYPHARKGAHETALDRYLAKPDPNFKWELVRTDKEDGLTSYTLDMTSQQWRTEKEVNRPLWKHWVTISVPSEVKHTSAMMFIDGGSNREGAEPRGADGMMKQLARDTHSIACSIFMIPNEPLIFADAFGWERTEDALIAYTWDKFYRTGDEEWPARLPMTKAVVRAMDAVQAFCASEAGGKHTINDFVVAGGSKRGWTTWTTGMSDTRVRAIIPCVIDLLSVIESFRHHWSALGFWSAAIGDYQALGILNWLDTPENAALMAIIDPINHLDRLQMPKLIINGANDQFFLPDSSRFYWQKLQGPKWLRYMPNAGHGLIEEEAYRNLASFYYANISNQEIPAYDFTFGEDGSITATLRPGKDGRLPQPTAVKLWQAHNPEARDFRGNKAAFTDTPVAPSAPGAYTANITAPEQGYTAYFLEITLPGPLPHLPYTFTSGVRVAPDTYPAQYTPPANPPKGFITGK